MKVIISIMLVLSVSLNSYATPVHIQELSRIIDNHHYTMSVEWNQIDQDFYEKAYQKSLNEVATYMQKYNLGKEDLLALAKLKGISESDLKNLELKLSLSPAPGNSSEVLRLATEFGEGTYKKGASWNGLATAATIGAIGIITFAAFIWWHSQQTSNNDCVGWSQCDSGDANCADWARNGACLRYEPCIQICNEWRKI